MKKKILIGSIVAVVILVLVSFTSVVGYISVESNVKASPLFKVRTNRAIGEESKVLTAKYFGKGITLWFPKRDDKLVMTREVVDSIRKIDDETFDRFIANIINYAKKDKRFNDINSDRIREALHLIRYSNKLIPILDSNVANITFGYGFKGILGCIISPVLWLIGGIVLLILFIPYCLFGPKPRTRGCSFTSGCIATL